MVKRKSSDIDDLIDTVSEYLLCTLLEDERPIKQQRLKQTPDHSRDFDNFNQLHELGSPSFRSTWRMTPTTFDKLLSIISPKLPSPKGSIISKRNMLYMFLERVSTRSTLQSNQKSQGRCMTTINKYFGIVMEAIILTMFDSYVLRPGETYESARQRKVNKVMNAKPLYGLALSLFPDVVACVDELAPIAGGIK